LEVFSSSDAAKFEGLFRSRLASRIREQDELALQEVSQFALPGYCVVCNRMSQFATDRMFAATDAQGRWTPAWRERQVCTCGFNCRQRSSYHVLTHLPGLTRQASVYCADRGPLFRQVRSAFPRAVGVEAAGTSDPAARLAFADGSLDCIFALDVLEHVPDVRTSLRDMARSLRPFGWLLITPTLHFDRAATVTRATVDDAGAVTHHHPPVHHPDPVDGRPMLAYREFGWDLLATLRESGFASAEVVVYTAPHYGYVGLQYVVLAGRGRETSAEIAALHAARGEGRVDAPRA
jgi:SAM-dependent methyltransferase